jgi:hypothetical protein
MARPKAEMRAAIIVPGVYSNRELCNWDETRPWMFKSWAGLLSHSDSYGKFEWNPWRISGLVYPKTAARQETFEEDMDLLAAAGLVVHDLEAKTGCFPNFEKHNHMSHYQDRSGTKENLTPEVESKYEYKYKEVELTGINPSKPELTPKEPILPVDKWANFVPVTVPRDFPAPTNGKLASVPPVKPKKLGFDPHEITEGEGGYTLEQIQKLVRYHWDESDNPFWRDTTNSHEFFSRNLEKMANAIPSSWLSPTKVIRKKGFYHPVKGPRD